MEGHFGRFDCSGKEINDIAALLATRHKVTLDPDVPCRNLRTVFHIQISGFVSQILVDMSVAQGHSKTLYLTSALIGGNQYFALANIQIPRQICNCAAALFVPSPSAYLLTLSEITPMHGGKRRKAT